jgi:hypothetical protein
VFLVLAYCNCLFSKEGIRISEKIQMCFCPGRRGLVELSELSAPDNVVSMAWCGDSLCLGIRREYVLINTSSGAVTEVFNCGPMAPPLVLPLQNGEVLLGKVCIYSGRFTS